MGNKSGPVYKSPVSKSIPYDDQNIPTNLGADVQTALDNLFSQVQASASPGFTYGRSGTLPAGTWLLVDTVPCNKSSRINFLSSAFIKKVFVANEDPNIIKIAIYTHDGNETNLTLLTTVTTAAARSNIFSVNVSVPSGKQIAVKVADDSPSSGKNLDVGLLLSGSVA